MKTVLFIDDHGLSAAFRRTRSLFDSFVASGQLLICSWDSLAFSLSAIRSFLAENIDADEKWRAIIVSDLSRENLSDCVGGLWRSGYGDCDDSEEGLKQDTRLKQEQSPYYMRLKRVMPFLDENSQESLKSVGYDAETGYLIWTSGMPEPPTHFYANPFDVAGNYGTTNYPSEIQHPVVTLSQMLGGLPAHILDESGVGLSYTQRASLFNELSASDEDSSQKHDLENELLERIRKEYPETTREGYPASQLTLPCPSPADVLLVSYRDYPPNISASTFEQIEGTIGGVRSEFAIRNHYPDKARFIVVDRLREGSALRIKEDLVFWAGILLLALHPERSFGMQSYTLHRMDVGVDLEEFSEGLLSKYSYASSARALLEEELENEEKKLVPDEDDYRPVPSYSELIGVQFNVPDSEGLSIPVRKYGWLKDTVKPYDDEVRNLGYGFHSLPGRMKDVPALDLARYQVHRAGMDSAMDSTLEEPRYALRTAVRDFEATEPFDMDVLTGFRANSRQRETLEKGLEDLELDLTSTYSLSLLNSDVYHKAMHAIDERVRGRLQPRAYAREVSLVVIMVALVAALSFLPFIFGWMTASDASQVARVSWEAACVSILAIAVILSLGIISLKLSHLQVRRMLKKVNKQIEHFLQELRIKAGNLGDRISGYATYKKGFSLLARQYSDATPSTVFSRELHRRRKDIGDFIQEYSLDLLALGIEPMQVSGKEFLTWSQAEQALDSLDFFSVEPEMFFPIRPFNEYYRLGETVSVPFQFIEWFELKTIRLFEPGLERGVDG